MPDIFETPILTARETARYIGMHESTLERWLAVVTPSSTRSDPRSEGGPGFPSWALSRPVSCAHCVT
jgi:hypothetical protein